MWKTITDFPDADILVLLRLADDQPLSFGFTDGERWYLENGAAARHVTGWLHLDEAAVKLDQR